MNYQRIRYKRVTLWVSMLMLLLTNIVNAQGILPCRFIPEVPVVGQEVKIIYDCRRTLLANSDTVECVLYFWKNLHWEAEDLELVKNDTAWEASFQVPEECGLITCKFYAGDSVDTGGRSTYATMTFNQERRNLPGAQLGWGMFRNKTLMSLPGYCDTTAYIPDNIMGFWINQQLMNDPNARRYVFYYAGKLLNSTHPGKWNDQIRSDVDYILSLQDVDEPTLLKALEITRDILKDSLKTIIVEQRVLNDYPNGILARDKEITRLLQERGMGGKIDMESFLTRFPVEKFKHVETNTTSLHLKNLFSIAIYEPVDKRKENLYKYLHAMPREQLLTCYWHLVQIPFSHNKQVSAADVKDIANAIYGEYFARPRCGSERMWSPKEWHRRLLAQGKSMVLTQAMMLDGTGSSAEALELMEEVKGCFAFKSAEFNDFYVSLLAKNGYEAMVVPSVVSALREDAATPAMLDLLRKDYVARCGGDEGFDAYVESLKSPEQQQQLRKHLQETMLDEDITLYDMRDLDGNLVRLSGMKGKIIVLDFWATWCAPCKASFPGMQMAVNKYRNDPDVAFYFVSTMETAKDFKDRIRTFLEENNFSLHVLLDNADPSTGKGSAVYDAYAKQFHFSGIPHKLIIDRNGKLRWSVSGYMGSPSALAEELSTMIELLKTER